MTFALRPLAGPDLPQACSLLRAALPLDRADLVAQEKLFGDNGARQAAAVGAFSADGSLIGLMGLAGRYIKLLCVAPAAQGQGVGRALLSAARERLGGARARVCDHPGNYLSPGLDERYQAGRAFLSRHGFHEVARVRNLRVPLSGNPLVTSERARGLFEAAAARGYSVHRVAAEEQHEVLALLSMIREAFSPIWALEVARAIGVLMNGSPDPLAPELGSCVFAAYRAGAPVAFAAHDGNNRGLGWFGPMGTLPGHRGQGLGETLLLPCLLDVVDRPDGGVIAWVGPEKFYERACGAVLDRQFVVYEEE